MERVGGCRDAVVVGSGPNGLVAANLLADAGWSVLVLEEQSTPGGAVRTDDGVHPGFLHDTFSAFYPLAVASPALQSLRLEEHGLEWSHAPAVLGHLLGDDTWAVLHRDRQVTASLLDGHAEGDGAAWLELCEQWDRIAPSLVGALMTPFPPIRHGLGALARLPALGGLDFVRQLVGPVLSFGSVRFRAPHPTVLLAGNAGHSDIPADAPGSAGFGVLMTMLGQTVGFPVPRGGAASLVQALVRRLEERGGQVRCGARVARIEVDRRRVRGVRLDSGERIAVRRAVIADVSAPILFGRLVEESEQPARVVRGMRSFQLDPSTVKVDWALDGPVPWRVPPPHPVGTFHVADSLEEMATAQAQLAAGAIPARPFMLGGQMTTCDPTRSPAGTESLWSYTHVPQKTARDAGEEGIRGEWDRDDCERFGDRVQARMEALAPGFGSRVLARRVLGPREFEARNASLVGGAINGGTSQMHNELVFRPVPGLGRAETGIRGLFLGSSSAHPGGGVHGAPGANAARAALAHHRARLGLDRGRIRY